MGRGCFYERCFFKWVLFGWVEVVGWCKLGLVLVFWFRNDYVIVVRY